MEAKKDGNYVSTLLAVSSVDGVTPVTLYADPTTHRLLTDAAGGYTNLTQFVDQTPWRLFYSNVSGDVTELALGAAGTYLFSNGAAAAPTWSTPAGSGDVSKVGTPVNNQIGVWTGDGTIEGDTAFTFDTATDTLTIGVESGNGNITGATATTADTDGGSLNISGGAGLGIGEGGQITVSGAEGGATGPGGGLTFSGGPGGATSGDGGSANIEGGFATDGNGGNINLTPGAGGGVGINGVVQLFSPSTGIPAILDLSLVDTTDKTFTFPNISGTFALLTQDANFNTLTVNTNLVPDANDGAALGTTVLQFSDLFLAEGGVINFDNGDVTLTQTGNVLAVAGGDLRVATADVGTNADSVPTLSSTSTFTNKTLTSPTVNTATIGGATLLAEGASIDLDPALSADGTYSGIAITGTAGTTLAFGDLIYLSSVDSRWELVDADSVTTCGAVLTGMCVLAAAADGNATKILLQGNIRADAAFPALTVGANVYAGLTAGDIVTTAPSATDDVVHVVGKALTADSIYFAPSQDYITIV